MLFIFSAIPTIIFFAIFIAIIRTIIKNKNRISTFQSEIEKRIENTLEEDAPKSTYTFCDYCGTKIEEGKTECSSCGAKLSKK